MRRDVIGVLRDGTGQGVNTPHDARTPLQVPYGNTYTLRVHCRTSSGAPIDLTANGVSLIFTMKQSPADDSPIIPVKTGVVQRLVGKDVADFVLAATDLRPVRDQGLSKLVYDVVLVTSTSRDAVVPTSPFTILPGVAAPR